MELKNLHTVKKILETGSYQKAANALNYAQSTVTFQIKQVEGELGIQLFERKGRRMILTAAGMEVIPLIDQIIADAERLTHTGQQIGQITGELKIAVPESLVTYQLQPLLLKFKALAPDVKLTIQVLNCYDIYEKMVSEKLDLAIHYDVKPYSPDIALRHFGRFPLVLVASPKIDPILRDFTTANQNKQVCHLQNDPNALYLKIFDEYLRTKHIALATPMELWSIETIKRSVQSNLGVAYLPKFTVNAELTKHELIELPTDITANNLEAVVACRRVDEQQPPIRLFLKLINETFGKTADHSVEA
ncbi:LysR family transcriptional regulator [Pediococcus siamensis]|uniref:LysR family transcriptional regulator n=1 Tax=Pediococcus siamensis TaxID=381829 RepID=UPI0039A33741